MKEKLLDQLQDSLIFFAESRGLPIKIEEIITRTESQSFDRHLSTTSVFFMTISQAVWAISGNKLMILGESLQSYEVSFDSVIEVDLSNQQVTYKEKFGSAFHRHSIVTLLPKTQLIVAGKTMMLSPEQIQAFGSASNCCSLQEVLDLIGANLGVSSIQIPAAAYGMVLHGTQAVRETHHFADSRYVIDQLARAKAEIDIVAYHAEYVTSITASILSAAQQFLANETIGCHEWPYPEEIANVVINVAIGFMEV
jgi:hypothetical protein